MAVSFDVRLISLTTHRAECDCLSQHLFTVCRLFTHGIVIRTLRDLFSTRIKIEATNSNKVYDQCKGFHVSNRVIYFFYKIHLHITYQFDSSQLSL